MLVVPKIALACISVEKCLTVFFGVVLVLGFFLALGLSDATAFLMYLNIL